MGKLLSKMKGVYESWWEALAALRSFACCDGKASLKMKGVVYESWWEALWRYFERRLLSSIRD